jgi:Fic-DOC domain mobile mystery protein B
VDWRRVPVDLRNLLDDVRYHMEHGTYPADEIAMRFHHRLVAIHPFPNGNGRHARLMADLLVQRLGRPRFSWGSQGLVEESATRDQYIAALRAADARDYAPLLAFARS